LRVLGIDRRRGWIRLTPTTTLDLINLYRVIGAGDIVFQETTRELKKERATGRVDSERVSLKIGISVERKEVDQLMRRIRFHGRIVYSDRDVDALKKYHSLTIGRGDVLEVISRERLPLLQVLDDGRRRPERILAVSIDDEELALIELGGEGFKILKTWRLGVEAKRVGYQQAEDRASAFDELVESLRGSVSDRKVKIVILGTSVHVDLLLSEIKRRDAAIHSLVVRKIPTNVGGMDGLREALRRGALGSELKPLADAILVEKALRILVEHPEGVAIGAEEVARRTVEPRGALILVSEDFLWQHMGDKALEDILSRAERGALDLRVILPDTEAAEKINSLGGIVGVEKRLLDERV